VSKRPPIDLAALTAEHAAPMPEAMQRVARPAPAVPETAKKSANVIPLNFKVSAEFRRRFRERALDADLKLNELLVEALDAWEKVRGHQ
jgi:hypothetical protein